MNIQMVRPDIATLVICLLAGACATDQTVTQQVPGSAPSSQSVQLNQSKDQLEGTHAFRDGLECTGRAGGVPLGKGKVKYPDGAVYEGGLEGGVPSGMALIDERNNTFSQLYRMWLAHRRPPISASATGNHRSAALGILNQVSIDTL